MHGQHIDLRHGELFLAAGLKKAAADTEAGVVDENIDALVRQRLAETGALALLLQISRQDAAEGAVLRGELCGQSFESVSAAGGEDEPEAEAGVPAGKLPANAGRSSGYPYSFGHKLLLVKSGSLIDGFQLVSGEGGVVQGSDVVEDLLGLGRADEDARDLAVPQYPRQRHLGQRLAAGGSDFVQGAYLCQLFLGDDALLQETAIGADAAVLRDAVEVAVGQQTLRQRAEGDDALVQPDGSLFQAVLLDGAVKDGVAVLVDDEGDVELVEDGAGFSSVSPL